MDVHDIYEDARASVAQRERRRWPMALLTTAAALLIGAAAGWMVADHGRAPALPWLLATVTGVQPAGSDTATTASPAAEPLGGKATATRAAGPSLLARATRHLAADTASVQPNAAVWPIALHRAGDGRFYADLSLDGHLINILVDPTARATRLTPAELPPTLVRGSVVGLAGDRQAGDGLAGDWQAGAVLLEHVRLPPTSFPVIDAPAVEAAIGADLLGRHFIVEEQFDRLRLVPRHGAS